MTTSSRSEKNLLEPLLRWLRAVRRIRTGTVVAKELHWFGRHVDVATLSSTGRLAAYELKITHNGRALEQAAYNRLAFDRSYVVSAREPSEQAMESARSMGIGVIVVSSGGVRMLLDSPHDRQDPYLRSRLVRLMRATGVAGNRV